MTDFNVSIVFTIPFGDQDKLVLGISSLCKFVLDIGYTIKSKGCVKYLYYTQRRSKTEKFLCVDGKLDLDSPVLLALAFRSMAVNSSAEIFLSLELTVSCISNNNKQTNKQQQTTPASSEH